MRAEEGWLVLKTESCWKNTERKGRELVNRRVERQPIVGVSDGSRDDSGWPFESLERTRDVVLEY